MIKTANLNLTLVTTNRPLAPIILKLNTTRKRPVPSVLPWGKPLVNITVNEFLKDYKIHLSFVFAQLRLRTGSYNLQTESLVEQLINATAKINAANQTLVLNLLKQMRKQLAEEKQQTQQEIQEKEEEAQEKLESEENDPVAAVVSFLLSLIGF